MTGRTFRMVQEVAARAEKGDRAVIVVHTRAMVDHVNAMILDHRKGWRLQRDLLEHDDGGSIWLLIVKDQVSVRDRTVNRLRGVPETSIYIDHAVPWLAR